MANTVFLFQENDKLKNDLLTHGVEVKEYSLDEKLNRVSLLRSNILINNFEAKDLKSDEFYQKLDIIEKLNRGNKPLVYVCQDASVEAAYDEIYSDISLSDDKLLRADDFRDTLDNSNVCIYQGDISNVLKAIGFDIELKIDESAKKDNIDEPYKTDDDELDFVSKVEAKEELNNDSFVVSDAPEKIDETKVDLALEYFEKEEYERAFAIFMQTEDDKTAANYIGYMYQQGLGIDKDLKKAYEYYRKASYKKEVDSYLRLADCYYYGLGVDNNLDLAEEYYKKSIEATNDKDAMLHLANLYFYDSEKQDYVKALEIYTKLLDDPTAIYNIGYCLYNGFGTEVDKGKALGYFERAAKLGNIDAINMLGNMSLLGEEMQSSQAGAYRYYEQAAKKNNPSAIYNLGVCYFEGIGIKVDRQKAIKLFQKAASLDVAEACYRLGNLSDNGDDVELDYVEAYKWYLKAAEGHHKDAEKKIGDYFYFGNNKIKMNKTRAFEWYLRSAIDGNVDGMIDTAMCFRAGIGTEANQAKAFYWYQKAADTNNPKALNLLGDCYLLAIGVESNTEKAFESYEKAANMQDPDGELNLGKCYYNGYGVKKSYVDAARWYQKAALHNNLEAMVLLGNIYMDGLIGQDYAKALTWYKKAAKKEYGPAYYMLGKMYKYGNGGLQKSDENAYRCYTVAANFGDEAAMFELAEYYSEGHDQNLKKAFEYYEEASSKNYYPATLKLAMCYYAGLGCEQDKDYSYSILKKLSDLGYSEATKFIEEHF